MVRLKSSDLSFFNRIVPCGITDCQVTSMEKLLGAPQNIQDVKLKVVEAFNNNIRLTNSRLVTA